MDIASQVAAIDIVALTPIVRAVLGSDTAAVGVWEHRPLGGGVMTVGGLYRFAGAVRDGGVERPWSVVLKVLSPTAGSVAAAPAARNYWKREALAYESGLLDDLPGGLGVPRCYASAERPEGTVWLWLQDLGEDAPRRWSLERYALAAYHLGRFNGTYLAGRPLPAAPWIATAQQRQGIGAIDAVLSRLAPLHEQPHLRRYVSRATAERMLAFWAQRDAFLSALDRLPHVFCHYDAFRRNLFSRQAADGREETIAIDWACCGIGAVGEELRHLVLWSALFFEVDADLLRELDALAFAGYVAGLQEAGWHGDPRLARLGYAASCAFVAVLIQGLIELDAPRRAHFERAIGHTYVEIMERMAAVRHFALDRADEAQELLRVL